MFKHVFLDTLLEIPSGFAHGKGFKYKLFILFIYLLISSSLLFIVIAVGSEIYLRGKSVRSWCDGSSDRSLMMDLIGLFLVPATTGVTKAVVCVILSVG